MNGPNGRRAAGEPYDLLVIGGGANGAGIARDAAGRGLSVLLCEKDDLAQGTSSRSSKLIHGGLRYLEHYEFRLVREALIEREVLLRAAPHIVWPLRFVLPHSPEQRPAWLVRLGLFLYDHLGGRETLPGTRRLDLRSAPEGAPLKPDYPLAFEYSDCWVEDSRLVVLNALDAQARGAEVLVRTEAAEARREDGLWRVVLRAADGAERTVRARALANAAGPWVERVLWGVAGRNASARVRLVKGSHIVVRKPWGGPQAYLFQNADKRVVFAIPFADDFTLIGTTDTPYEGDAGAVAIDDSERDYLLAAANRYLRAPLRPEDIVRSFSGVRPLHDADSGKEASAVTRDYVFDVEAGEAGQAPLLSVFGGKITTYRKLAEHALAKLAPHLPPGRAGAAWTATAPLPGGDLPGPGGFDGFLAALRREHPWLEPAVARHYARAYGTRAAALLDGARGVADLGRRFGTGLYEREADFLRRTEWARTGEDVLERRTRHGLRLGAAERDAFSDWMARTA